MVRTTQNKLFSLDKETIVLVDSLKSRLGTKENEVVKIALLNLEATLKQATDREGVAYTK
jgi:hypothetical protein